MFFRRRRGQKYIDRGDLAGYDFDTGDFTKNTAWHDLDLSAIVGTGVKRVVFSVIMASSDVAAQIQVRQKGNVYTYNMGLRGAAAIGLVCVDDIEVLTNAAGIIEYQLLTGTYETLNVAIRGYYV